MMEDFIKPEPMSLRAQLYELACRRINKAWADHVLHPMSKVEALAAKAFLERWPEGDDTCILRAVYEYMGQNGGILPESVLGISLSGK